MHGRSTANASSWTRVRLHFASCLTAFGTAITLRKGRSNFPHWSGPLHPAPIFEGIDIRAGSAVLIVSAHCKRLICQLSLDLPSLPRHRQRYPNHHHAPEYVVPEERDVREPGRREDRCFAGQYSNERGIPTHSLHEERQDKHS